MSSTLETVEYSYDDKTRSLDPEEALERYRHEKALHPDALVILDLLHCNKHWDVKVLQTAKEKEVYLAKTVHDILERFINGLDK